MKILFLIAPLLICLSIDAVSEDFEKNVHSGKLLIDFDRDPSIDHWVLYSGKAPLIIFSEKGQVLDFLMAGDSLKIFRKRYETVQGKNHGLFVSSGDEKMSPFEVAKIYKNPVGGLPTTLKNLPKPLDFRGPLLIIFLVTFLLLAGLRLANNFSYSFISQPFIAIGKVSILDHFSSGFFPLIFLSIFFGFCFLLGTVIDICLPNQFNFDFSAGGYIGGSVSAKYSLLFFGILFVFSKFLLYNFLGYLAGNKDHSAHLIVGSLILSSVLLLTLTILISLAGFGNLLLEYPKIVPVIFFIFAALFGIGMIFTQLNLGDKVSISVRFFGIIAMEILPTILIVKVLL